MRLSNILIALGVLALITAAPACASDDDTPDNTNNTTADAGDTPMDDAGDMPMDDAGDMPMDDAGDMPMDDAGDMPMDDAGDMPMDDAGDMPMDDAGDMPMDDAGATEGGACTGDDDMAIIADQTVDVSGVATTAAYACLTDPDIGACVAAAVETETGISNGCALCYAEQVVCAATNCLAVCLDDSEAPDCVECRNTNCLPLFEPCAGFDPSAGQ